MANRQWIVALAVAGGLIALTALLHWVRMRGIVASAGTPWSVVDQLAFFLDRAQALFPDRLRTGALWDDPFSIASLWGHGFAHGDWFHFAVNMVPLVVLGTLAAARIGAWRFLLLYALAIPLSGMAYALMEVAPLIGASGAVHLVWGAVAMWAFLDGGWPLTVSAAPVTGRPASRGAGWVLALAWIAAALALNAWFVSLVGWNFAWEVHLAGFVLGLAIAPFFLPSRSDA